MAILYGTTADGDSLPVEVNELGQLVAQGLDGPVGLNTSMMSSGSNGHVPEFPSMRLDKDEERINGDSTVRLAANSELCFCFDEFLWFFVCVYF